MNRLILIILLMTTGLLAQTFNVSTTPELRTALESAATNGEDDTITLADGTYKTTDDGGGTFIYLSNEDNNLTLIGSSSANVILSGDNVEQIFNHNSTLDAPLKLEKLSFVDGNNTAQDGNGGGVKADYTVDVLDCNFTNNTASSSSHLGGYGGGFYSNATTTVTDSTFTNNSSSDNGGYGGGFYSNATTTVTNSIFINNSSSSTGGGFYSNAATVTDSTFTNNSAISSGGGFTATATTVTNSTFINNSSSDVGGGFKSYATIVINSTFANNSSRIGAGFSSFSSSATVTNSTFTNNSAISKGGGFDATATTVTNSTFINNSSGIYISTRDYSIIVNSIFFNNDTSDIRGGSSASIAHLDNNYLDPSKVRVSNSASNNIFEGVTLGFVDEANGDYNLTAVSDLIDAGTTSIARVTLPTKDLNGNVRILGGTIDIGPYEFSPPKPTINAITFTGTATKFSELTFSVDYNLADSRTLSSIEYDFLNDGSWTSSDTHTFNTAGTYTVTVQVTDSAGEFSLRTTTVIVAPLSYADMTEEQKLKTTIDPTHYDDIITIIENQKDESRLSGITVGENNVVLTPSDYGLYSASDLNSSVTTATTTGIATGKTYVISHPLDFNLTTLEDKNTSVIAATAIGVESGKALVIATPSSFGIDVVTPLQVSDITSLPVGWNMVAIPSTITNMSIFDSAEIVWYMKDDVWSAYTSNSETASSLSSAGISVVTSIPANSAIWVKK